MSIAIHFAVHFLSYSSVLKDVYGYNVPEDTWLVKLLGTQTFSRFHSFRLPGKSYTVFLFGTIQTAPDGMAPTFNTGPSRAMVVKHRLPSSCLPSTSRLLSVSHHITPLTATLSRPGWLGMRRPKSSSHLRWFDVNIAGHPSRWVIWC